MTIIRPPAQGADTPLGEEPLPSSSFEQRWDAWQSRRAAHEEAFRRKVTVAAPVVVVVAVVILYVLLGG